MNTHAKCPRCEDGTVPCQYAYRPGSAGGAPWNSWPDESEVEEIGECEECGAKDWTPEEVELIEASAAENYSPSDDDDN